MKKENKEYNNGFIDGYMIGMRTAFDFMIGYCNDYKNQLKKDTVYKALNSKKRGKHD